MKNNRSYRKLYIVFFIIVLQGYSPLTFCQDNVIDSGFKQLFSGSQLQDPGNKRDSIGQCMQMMYEYHYYVSYIEFYGCDHFYGIRLLIIQTLWIGFLIRKSK